MQIKKYGLILLFLGLIAAIAFLFPWLFENLIAWQRQFNQLLSDSLHQIQVNPIYAGSSLIAVSFLYGIFHALGPGHGKFIITSYLATHQSQLTQSMRLTFFSSLMQGIVAIVATSVIVVGLNLSSAYFKLSQLWLERIAYGLIFLLGLQWLYQSGKSLYLKGKSSTMVIVGAIRADSGGLFHKIGTKSAVKNSQDLHCGCGHQHLPNPHQLARSTDFKSQCLVILSIGMRPCTGAIFILFLAYMLDLYFWGMLATMAMAVGTGLTLSCFALLVQYARQTAVKLGKWYLSPSLRVYFSDSLKGIFALLLLGFAASLMYATTLPSAGGATLFGR